MLDSAKIDKKVKNEEVDVRLIRKLLQLLASQKLKLNCEDHYATKL